MYFVGFVGALLISDVRLKKMVMKKEYGNIIDDDGKILLFSIDNFVENICKGDTCFVCGVERKNTIFNDEHVIPRWVLKRYDLFGKGITLPNGKEFKYGKYKIPCCKSCNSLLGDGIEKKISEGFNGNFDEVLKFFNEHRNLVFVWICLIYIKTHLTDKMFKYDFKSDKKISDVYNWNELHHIHCMARSIYTGVNVNQSVYGSMFIYPCDEIDYGNKYDYIDLYGTGTILIRLGAFFIICVIGDCKLTTQLVEDRTRRITGKLNFLQMRELYSRVTYENLRIIDRPRYLTIVKDSFKNIEIDTRINESIRIAPHNEAFFGELMYHLVKDLMFTPEHPELKEKMSEQVQAVKDGQWTYLFDSEGKFLNDSTFIVEDEDELVKSIRLGSGAFTR